MGLLNNTMSSNDGLVEKLLVNLTVNLQEYLKPSTFLWVLSFKLSKANNHLVFGPTYFRVKIF